MTICPTCYPYIEERPRDGTLPDFPGPEGARGAVDLGLCTDCRSRPRAWRSVRCRPCSAIRRREVARRRQMRRRSGRAPERDTFGDVHPPPSGRARARARSEEERDETPSVTPWDDDGVEQDQDDSGFYGAPGPRSRETANPVVPYGRSRVRPNPKGAALGDSRFVARPNRAKELGGGRGPPPAPFDPASGPRGPAGDRPTER